LNVTNQFKIARDKAEAERDAILMEQDAAIKAAVEKIKASFSARISVAKNEFNRCTQELLDHVDATSSHEWEGKRVSKVVTRYRYNWDSVTQHALYGIPPIGKAFVRLLKTDGTPDKAFDGLSGRSLVKEV
jgi:tRNA/tmRNA/rRNA uracil-C5-methylase (TrmA/RlmC/RlmD family)